MIYTSCVNSFGVHQRSGDLVTSCDHVFILWLQRSNFSFYIIHLSHCYVCTMKNYKHCFITHCHSCICEFLNKSIIKSILLSFLLRICSIYLSGMFLFRFVRLVTRSVTYVLGTARLWSTVWSVLTMSRRGNVCQTARRITSQITRTLYVCRVTRLVHSVTDQRTSIVSTARRIRSTGRS